MKKFTGAATISCAVIALALTACAPQSNENGAASADDAKETPITVAWSADSECGTCHATEQASYDDAACVASTHEGQACISCVLTLPVWRRLTRARPRPIPCPRS